ncbi:MAG: nucleotidyltransferase domain-containing protein [Anaerolineae bacterium]|nr:nucleotidyltransferase domain-containing protein [Anaerolineae bacterium]
MATSEIVAEMATRIRETVCPDKIILFGSRAREEARPDSDFDLLVIAPSTLPRWRRTPSLYRLLAGLGVSKDIVWWTPEEVEEWRGAKSHFINTAIREGKVLYERSA